MDTVRKVEHSVAASRRPDDVPEVLDIAQLGVVSEEEWRAHWPTIEPEALSEAVEDEAVEDERVEDETGEAETGEEFVGEPVNEPDDAEEPVDAEAPVEAEPAEIEPAEAEPAEIEPAEVDETPEATK